MSQGMNDAMGHVLGARTELEHGKNFRTGVDGQPEPQHLRMAAEPGSQFIQLKMREVEMAEEALVQGVRVPARTREPPRHRGLSKALRPARRQKDPALQPGQRAPWRPGAREFSDGTAEYRVER